MARVFILITLSLLCRFNAFAQDSTINENRLINSDTIILNKPDKLASFPGGISAWKKYLLKKLKLDLPQKKGAAPGIYTVYVKFIVAEDGTVSNIKATTNHGYGMEEEVIRIINKGPKWIPAKLNDKNVRSFILQPLTFIISE